MKQLTKFDIRQTNIAKGIAVLMLLWHHLFYNNPESFDRYISVYQLSSGIPIEVYISVFCKVCVAIFVFLSGYGLYLSFKKSLIKTSLRDTKFLNFSLRYTIKRLIKLLSDYWFIFIIFVPLGFIFNRSPIEIYEGNIFYFIGDFLGLAKLYNGPTMNATWWFMGLIIVLYILFPIVFKIIEKNEILMLSISFALTLIPIPYDNVSVRIYLLPFVIGMIFAKNNLFDKFKNYGNNHTFIFTAFALLLLIITTFLFRHIYLFGNANYDGLIAVPIILFSFMVISRIKFIDKAFEVLGKYSSGIFMFHTFIFSYYFKSFIYSFKYSVLIFIVLTVICLAVAVLLEWIKKVIGYKKLVDFCINKMIKA